MNPFMKSLSAICLVLFFLNFNAVQASENLKVMSLNFNSETVYEDKHSKLRDIRFLAAVEWIKANQPDVILIQEGWNYHWHPSVVVPLAEAVGYDYHYRLTMGAPGILLDSNGVLVKKKFKLSNVFSKKLPHASLSLGGGREFILSLGASSWAIGGQITLQDGSTIFLVSTHLIGKDVSTRNDQAHALSKIFPEGARLILAGDFNLTPESDGVKGLVSKGYQDSFTTAHPLLLDGVSACTLCGDEKTDEFNPMTIAPGQIPKQDELATNERIDYIFAKGNDVKVLSSQLVFTEPLHQVWMSDHYGVLSEFEIGNENKVNQSKPNLMNDRTLPLNKAKIIELTDADYRCDFDGCTHELPEINTSYEKGVVFINRSQRTIKIQIEGEGNIWPRDFARINPGRVAAFFFEPNKQYQFSSRWPWSRKKLWGNINSL